MKKADGAKVVGKKIGLTSQAMQVRLNVNEPDYGRLHDGRPASRGGTSISRT